MATGAPPNDGNDKAWDPQGYQHHAGFVAAYGSDLIGEWIDPKGRRILDLGCGDGSLTLELKQAGADVVGIDASADQVEAARARGLDARVMSGMALDFDAEFDAVFTNAAIHWMPDQAAVCRGVARALKPNGLFVGEFGGFGNVAAITTALCAVGEAMDGDVALAHANTYPTVRHWTGLMESAGLGADRVTTFYRPTPLPTDIRGWLTTFREPFFAQFGTRRDEAYDRVVRALSPSLQDEDGNWFADYVRLRFRATKAA